MSSLRPVSCRNAASAAEMSPGFRLGARRRRRVAPALLAAVSCLAAAPAPSPAPTPAQAPAPAPAEEARARALFKEIRCVVCQNESIDNSQAEIAADLRRVVREQVAAGRSNGEVRAFLVARYGEFVMFRPAFSPGNAALWLTPFLVVLGGLGLLVARARRAPPVAPLDTEEAERLRALNGTEPFNRNVI
ncbi:MAG: cytochrome c-type biogenesis protein CcmH [Proteobacteria bacterium]|nr:cytochrome c-type biogenesis protein CcmH [Pseudomonadota bacterium]